MITVSFAVTNDQSGFEFWLRGGEEVGFSKSRKRILASSLGKEIEARTAPHSVFGPLDSWTTERYRELCNYAHGRGGYTNGDMWESNGPIYPLCQPRVRQSALTN